VPGVARLLSTAFCVALLGATAGAYAVSERAKTELVPLYRPQADSIFSPDCGCPTDAARIDFRLRRSDRLTIWLERDGKRASTLVPGREYPAGPVALEFDGIDDSGLTLPEGKYRPVVHLARAHRTIELPNTIVLDTTPPAVHVRHRIYTHISPDGDGRADSFRIRYTLGERGRGILAVDGRQAAITARPGLAGELVWNGRVRGRLVRPGSHVLEISAQDAAGNRTDPFPFAVVTVRYVALGRPRVVVKPGGRFAILALSDAREVDWRLHGAHGLVRPGTLRLRAPARRGVYRLYVTAAGHAAKAFVVVA
jgi:hypothetical protein